MREPPSELGATQSAPRIAPPSAAHATEVAEITPARSRHRLHTFDAFAAHPPFRFLWTSNFLFFAGTWTQTLVLGWLAYELTGSAVLLSLFAAVRMSPMLLGPIGGAIADRVDRINFLLVTQCTALLAATTISLLASFGAVEYWHLLVTGAVVSLGQAPSQPARFTLAMDIVGREGIMNANALNAVALNSTMVIGPAIGGALVATVGVVASLWLIVCWFLLATGALLMLKRNYRGISGARPAAGQGVLDSLLFAIRLAWNDRRVRMVLLVTLAANSCAWPVHQGFLPVFAEEIFEVGVGGLSAITATIGIGMLSGSLTLASLSNLPRKGMVYTVGTLVFGLGFALFAASPSFPLALVLCFITGAGAAGFMVMQSTLLLLVASEEARGRLLGMQVLAIGILPPATLVHGFLASEFGVVATTVGAGVLLATAMVAVLATQPWFRSLA